MDQVVAPSIDAISNPRKCVVYGLSSSSDGRLRYVGQTVTDIGDRLKNHIRHARKYPHRHLSCWIKSVIASGHEVVADVLVDDAVWNETEISVIAKMLANGAKLVNATSGGDGALGVAWTDERRKNLSLAMTGKKKSPEHVEKMAATKRGVSLSDETKQKISAALKGKTPKNLADVQRGNKGLPRPQELRDRIRATLKATREAKAMAASINQGAF